MQAVQSRRYAFTGTVIAIVVAAIVLVGILAVRSFDSESAGSPDMSLPAPAVPQFDEIKFMETNTQQIPYTPAGDAYTGTLPER